MVFRHGGVPQMNRIRLLDAFCMVVRVLFLFVVFCHVFTLNFCLTDCVTNIFFCSTVAAVDILTLENLKFEWRNFVLM